MASFGKLLKLGDIVKVLVNLDTVCCSCTFSGKFSNTMISEAKITLSIWKVCSDKHVRVRLRNLTRKGQAMYDGLMTATNRFPRAA